MTREGLDLATDGRYVWAEKTSLGGDDCIGHFKKIVPNDYQKMMTEIAKGEERGLNHDEAVLEAFKKLTA